MKRFSCTSEWLAATFSPDARITSVSCRAEQKTGYGAQELVGRPLAQILADPSAMELPRMMEAAKEGGYWEGRILHHSRDGTFFESRGLISTLENPGHGNCEYLLISIFDEFEDSGQCTDSVVADIAANLRRLAHDLNNPLAVTMGFAQLLLLDQHCQGKIRTDLEKLYSELKRITQVVEKLHEYARSLYEKHKADSESKRIGLQVGF